MEIIAPKENLYPALQMIQAAADKRNVMPILSHILLQTTEHGLRLAATDLELAMETHIQVNVVATGEAAVPCRKLFEVVREMPEGTVHLKLEPEFTLRISCQKAVIRLKGLDPAEFPAFKKAPQDNLTQVKAKLVAEMIDKTLYAVAGEDMQFNLAGIHVEKVAESGETRFVATDGNRLSLVDRPVDLIIPEGSCVILPRKGVVELRKLLSEQEELLSWGLMDNQLVALVGGYTLYMRLVDGIFPSYQDVIPRFGANRARVNREQFSLALRRASLLSSQRFYGVNVSFSKQGVSMASNNPEVGDSAEVIQADFSGEPVSILFNPKYLTDLTGCMESETILLEMNDESSAVIVKDPTDEKFLAVVMPMRL
jgi:DNA polymerase-3 subunit beta